MAQPFLVALELGLHPDASIWRNYGDVVQCVISEVSRRMPHDPLGKGGAPAQANRTAFSPVDQVDRWVSALPTGLQSKRGVHRIYLLAPSFIVELLEGLLKESGRTNLFGEACRRCFSFLVEAITPLVPSGVASKETSFSTLVTTAQFTLDYVGGPGGLAIATSLLFSGIASVPSLLPMLRRRLQEIVKVEECWTADAAAMMCVTYLDGLVGVVKKEEVSPPASESQMDSIENNPWSTIKNREATPRLSARKSSQLADSRDASPKSGEFVMLSKDPSFVNIPFPEKMPTVITVPSAVIVSVAVLSSATLTVQPALKLGQWCLQALHTLPLTITACALAHLLLKFPKAFRVSTTAVSTGLVGDQRSSSSSPATALRFCEVVIIHCCRIVTTLFERRLQHGVHGAFSNSEECVLEMDDVVQSVDVMPCFLLLCIQAIQCNLGLPLCDEAQRYLGRLFVHASRLYVSHHSFVEEGSAGASGGSRNGRETADSSVQHDTTLSPSRRRGFVRDPMRKIDVVSSVFRASLRAVDLVLHDYAAGNPETLRQMLAQAGPPNGVLVNRAQEYGASVDHQDLMETISAATDPQLDSRIKTYITNTVNTTAKQAQNQAASKFSLIGWIPASADLPILGGYPFASDGGLSPKQKLWVVRRMLDYFKREWFLARVGLQTVQLTTTVPGGTSQREGFFDCLPKAL